jgi:hypothetical protein
MLANAKAKEMQKQEQKPRARERVHSSTQQALLFAGNNAKPTADNKQTTLGVLEVCQTRVDSLKNFPFQK